MKNKISNQRGSPFDSELSEHGLKTERCTIVDVFPDTYSCTVRTETGRHFANLPWPSLSSDPQGLAGDILVPRRGQIVIFVDDVREPYLSFSLPTSFNSSSDIPQHSVIPGGEIVGGDDTVYAGQGRKNFRGGKPADVLPGDRVIIGTQGNLLAVLESGTSILKGSELSKVICNSVGDLLQLIGRNTDIYTDFGEVSFTNDGGHVNMSLRGGAQQTTESSTEIENFTIQADLGHAGELVDFRICDTHGGTLAQVHFAPDGSVVRYAAGNVTENIVGIYNVTLNAFNSTIATSYIVDVGGDSSETVGGSKNITASGNSAIHSGNDASFFGNRDVTIAAGRFGTISIGGSTENTPGDAAFTTTIVNGSWIVDIGASEAGDMQSAMSGYQLSTYDGDITFKTTLGNFNVQTTTPSSVNLGGNSGLYTAMLFEMFETWTSAIGVLLDTHTHGSAVGPTGPPIAPIYSATQSLITPIGSTYVKLGG